MHVLFCGPWVQSPDYMVSWALQRTTPEHCTYNNPQASPTIPPKIKDKKEKKQFEKVYIQCAALCTFF